MSLEKQIIDKKFQILCMQEHKNTMWSLWQQHKGAWKPKKLLTNVLLLRMTSVSFRTKLNLMTWPSWFLYTTSESDNKRRRKKHMRKIIIKTTFIMEWIFFCSKWEGWKTESAAHPLALWLPLLQGFRACQFISHRSEGARLSTGTEQTATLTCMILHVDTRQAIIITFLYLHLLLTFGDSLLCHILNSQTETRSSCAPGELLELIYSEFLADCREGNHSLWAVCEEQYTYTPLKK